jgi:hypothetical protein
MTSRTRVVAIVVLTAICAASSASAQARQASPAAQGRQAGPPDHWSLAPALATSCYNGDDFFEKVEAARTAIAAEIEKQDKVNKAARERFDNMDGAERGQRLVAFMTKNPEAAMKMMQAQQAAGEAGQKALEEVSVSSGRLEAELKRLQDAFRASAEQARKPVIARQDALIKAKTVPMGEAAMPAFTAAADHAQYVQLIAEENAAYAQACAPYFGPNGSFHKWASSYRTEVLDKIADAGADAVMGMQIQAMGLPDGPYRSIMPMEQANDFLRRVREVWAIRQAKIEPSIFLVKK